MKRESLDQLAQDYFDICEEFDEKLCPKSRGWPTCTEEYIQILRHEERVFKAILPKALKLGYTEEEFKVVILSKGKPYHKPQDDAYGNDIGL